MGCQKNVHFSTRAVHAGIEADPATGARITPIYQTASFVMDSAEHAQALFNLDTFGFTYSRSGNPTAAALEKKIADLEGGVGALALASGHAAQLIALNTLMETGDEFISTHQLYGGSINQFRDTFKRFGWQVKWADAFQPETIEALITDKTRAIFIESITNPSGRVTDIAAIADIANRCGVPLIVDNTMASPYLIRPIDHGAHVVVHSLTKFIGGHGNTIGGIIVDGGNFDWKTHAKKFPLIHEKRHEFKNRSVFERCPDFAFLAACKAFGLKDLGACISPFNAFLLLTGCETLPLRMQRHSENAHTLAEWLKIHPNVTWVDYAGFEENPNFKIAKAYCKKGFGSIFTFGVRGGEGAAKRVINHVKVFSHLANIGDTRSLIIHPKTTIHSQLTANEQDKAGVTPEALRISVGIEHIEDLKNDLDQALKA